MEIKITRDSKTLKWTVYYNGNFVTEQKWLWKAFTKSAAYFKSQGL